jgi:hypothetical protein
MKPHGTIRCRHDEIVAIRDLKLNPKNPNRHPDTQLVMYAAILEAQGIRQPVRISKRSGFVTKGHGQVEASKRNGWTHVPVEYQHYDSDEQEYADLVADNALAKQAEIDFGMVNAEMPELGPNFDLAILGIPGFTVDRSDKDGQELGTGEPLYTNKIKAPIYEPKGERPDLADLFDVAKTGKLIEEIAAADIPKKVKDFLCLAAQRHTVFNYEKIAEYYAHAPAEVQELMEKSALVIIDFNKAIENGFVVMTQDIQEAYPSGEAGE